MEQEISIVRACRVIDLDRSMWYYQSVKDDSFVEAKLLEYAGGKLANRGFPEYYKRIRKEGLIWNHKRVHRVYTKLGMNKRKRYKRRIPNPVKQPLTQPLQENHTWSMDFMHDCLESGRKIRTLNILDDYNREALAIEVDYSFPSERVTEVVKQLIEWRGKPEKIRTDNGTEFIAQAFENFCKDHSIEHLRIQKGKPSQNSYIERFNRSYRDGVLDEFIFKSLEEVREKTQEWMEDYNHHHPHGSLGDLSPVEFATSRKSPGDASAPLRPHRRFELFG